MTLNAHRIKWPDRRGSGLASPFVRGPEERPLRLTFHEASLKTVPAEEAEALATLRELAHLPLVEAYSTEEGEFPHLVIDVMPDNGDIIVVDVRHAGHTLGRGGIWHRQQWPEIAAKLQGHSDTQHPDVQAVLPDYFAALAHADYHRDLFVTLSPWLLHHRDNQWVGRTNPRRPSEAARLVGLFLRARDDYTYRFDGAHHRIDREGFYWVVARCRLPGMWRFFSACVQAGKTRGDDIVDLGGSILTRCARALEARDAIGEQYYSVPYNSTHDRMMYHFDYLTLLLAGALDAQARVVHRAFSLNAADEYNAGFRTNTKSKKKFVTALRQAGATSVANLVSLQSTQDALTILYELRNTIHGAVLPSATGIIGTSPNPPPSTVISNPRVRASAVQSFSLEHWGLFESVGQLRLDPYTCAHALVDAAFGLIDGIAAATDVSGLLPSSILPTQLLSAVPSDGLFEPGIRERLALLG